MYSTNGVESLIMISGGLELVFVCLRCDKCRNFKYSSMNLTYQIRTSFVNS